MWLSPVLAAPLRDFLASPATPPAKADSIFVLAGRQERKVFGVSLWRQGFAPELILSVGRFEWRRFYDLGLPSDGGLRECVDRTPPPKRHFFVRLRSGSAECTLVPEGVWALSEKAALRCDLSFVAASPSRSESLGLELLKYAGYARAGRSIQEDRGDIP